MHQNRGSDHLLPDIDDQPPEAEHIVNGYLLDTNILSDMIRNHFGLTAQHIEKINPKEIYTSIIVACELRYGCEKTQPNYFQASRIFFD